MKKNHEIIASYYENLWNKQDKSYIDKLLGDEIVFRGSLGIETHGKKEFEEYFDMITVAIPNLYHGVERIVAQDDSLAVKVFYSGTQTGKLFNFEATDRRIRYNGASFFRLEEGKIVDIWVLGDLNSLYQQLQ